MKVLRITGKREEGSGMRHTLIEVCALEPRAKQRKVKQSAQMPGMRNTSGGEGPEVSSEI